MSEEQKPVKAKEIEGKKKEKKGSKKSLWWFLGVIILVLISITFILPQTGLFNKDQSSYVSFGSYDGKKIELEPNSFFYFNLNNVYNQYVQAYGEENVGQFMYNIYYTAFQNSLINEDFQSLAKKAGFEASNKEISNAVVNNGFYSDGTSNFSQDVYNKAADSQKSQIVAWMEAYVPFATVQSDINNVKISQSEQKFISSLSEDRRSFEYLRVDALSYPDEEATNYYEENANLFNTVNLISATYATEEEATEAMVKIANGTLTMTEAVESSIDAFKSNEGKMENIYRYFFDNYLASYKPEMVDEIYSAEKNSLIGPVQNSSGYSIYYVTTPSTPSDITDESVLNIVKTYIANNEQDAMKSYLETLSAEVYNEAQIDFDEAADNYNLTIRTVGNAASNSGDSDLVLSLKLVDSQYNYTTGQTVSGDVYAAAKADKSYEEKLFKSEVGTVLEPVYSNNAYIIVRPMEAKANDTYSPSLLSSLYPSYAPQYTLMDYSNAILNSDKAVDDFMNGYISLLTRNN